MSAKKGATAAAAPPAVNVKVATLFTLAGTAIKPLGKGKYESRWDNSDSHPVAAATLSIVGQPAVKAVKTGLFGAARLDLSPLKPGTYVLRLDPAAAAELRTDPKKLDPVGPGDGDAKDAAGVCRFRPLEVELGIGAKGDLTSAKSKNVWGNALNDGAYTLVVDWKADWVAANAHRKRTKKISHVVLHRTGDKSAAPTPGMGLARFVNSNGASIHYMVDLDGHVIKGVVEDDLAWHAGPSYWDGQDGMSELTVGIEQVNADTATSFPKAQIDAVRDLVKRIRAAHGLSRHAVLAHGDIRVDDPSKFKFLLMDRPGCPGAFFDWESLGKAGETSYADPALFKEADVDKEYNGLFKDKPAFVLDNKTVNKTDAAFVDAKKKPYGVIASVQTKLATLGYAVSAGDGKTLASASTASGKYDLALASALDRFRRRFMPFGTVKDNAKLDGIFDRATAIALERTLADRKKP